MSKRDTWHSKKSDSTRVTILHAAENVFLQEGYAASMDSICKEAKVARRTLFQHFGSKEKLFRAMRQEMSDRSIAPLLMMLRKEGEITQILEEFGRQFAIGNVSKKTFEFLRLSISEYKKFPDLAHNHYDIGIKLVLPALQEFLARGIKKGIIRPGDPEILAEQFLCALIGYRLYRGLLGVPNSTRKSEIYLKSAIDSVLAR